MGSTFDTLCSDQLIKDYPSHMKNNVHYEVIMGSTAYGVSDDTSDMDIYGFCMPPKHILFPYNQGNIVGFGNTPENFKQFQQHHIIDKGRNKEYDISIYNIIKFFQLCMENNPNMVDALFVPTRCVLHSTAIGNHVVDNRKRFLSKRVWHKFKGYAYSQLHKMKSKKIREFIQLCNEHSMPYDLPIEEMVSQMKYEDDQNRMRILVGQIESGGKRSKRIPLVAKHGYDTKFAYHVVRLLDECQQILEEGTVDLTRSREHLKSIRRGERTMQSIIDYFDSKAIILENLYSTSKLPHSPDEDDIKRVLFECIEMHYGNTDIPQFSGIDNAYKYLVEAQKNIEKTMRMLS